MKRRALVLLVIAALVTAYLYASRSAWLGIPVQVVRVIDGDTIKVIYKGEETNVRLLGIDCMETHHTAKQAKQASEYGLTVEQVDSLGQRASVALQDALDDADRVRLVLPRAEAKRDYFRRLLAYVEADGKDVGLVLIRSGLAELYDTRHPRRERYRAARR